MPSLDFELPHWAYWLSLALFPLMAMLLARRGRMTGHSLVLGYLILATGGMLGLHRFYLRNVWGLLFLPLFLGILWANAGEREAREVQSAAANVVRLSESQAERYRPRVEGADARLEDLRAKLAEVEADGGATAIQKIRAKRNLDREEGRVEEARAALATAEAEIETNRPALEAATADRASWSQTARYLFYAILGFMGLDALLLPLLKRWADRSLAAAQARPEHHEVAEATDEADAVRDGDYLAKGWIGAVDRLSYYSGEFVSYWAVIAVLVYYYEVVARYVFNSPTNWAHEAMFLMFGMQYLISGAYAALTEAHVLVDIFYARWSPLGKAWVDLFTSIFYFIFAGTLLVTGWIFAMDATNVREVSFSEWQIAYWPFKWALVVGGLLIVAQGVAKVGRDIAVIRAGGLPPEGHPAVSVAMRKSAEGAG